MKSKVQGKPPGFGAHGVSLRMAFLGKTTEVFKALNVASASWFEVRDNVEVMEQLSEASGLGSSDWEDAAGTDCVSENTSGCESSCPGVEALTGELEALSLGPGPSAGWKPDLGPIDRAVRSLGEASEPSELVGDLAARFASMVLQRCAPFPGDDGSEPREGRFLVYRVQGTNYHCILDSGTPLNILEGDELIPSACLEDASFELGWHWAQKCYLAQGIHLDAPDMPLPDRYFCELGESILAMALIMLQTYESDQPNEEANDKDTSLFEGREGMAGMIAIRRRGGPEYALIAQNTLKDCRFHLRDWYMRNLGNWLAEGNIFHEDAPGDLPALIEESESEDEAEEADQESDGVWDNVAQEMGCVLESCPDKHHQSAEASNRKAPSHAPEWAKEGTITPSPKPLRSCKIGDLLVEGIRSMLELSQPYPGDEDIDQDSPLWKGKRFHVRQAWCNDEYTVEDNLSRVSLNLPKYLLLNPRFELAAWYVAQLSERLGIPK
ncbi:unnamed protein product [Mycena citricolor]|uniref:Uncharacterized protein n=1 Tax=Mycena citricolor TaxID=2018698 RepID=A0AAD2K2F9_9AGAR|nr:unnamed protein product [Mycena citricolor]